MSNLSPAAAEAVRIIAELLDAAMTDRTGGSMNVLDKFRLGLWRVATHPRPDSPAAPPPHPYAAEIAVVCEAGERYKHDRSYLNWAALAAAGLALTDAAEAAKAKGA